LAGIYEKIIPLDFKTFNLGLTLKNSYLERDDYLKSKFKIRGIENIKFSISNELAKKISKKTKSRKNTEKPDIFLQINLKDESCTISSKPIFVYGRYNKKIRNMPQKLKSCEKCAGLGCHNCNFTGLQNIESVEEKISCFFKEKFDSKQVQINWIGGEDQSSLVLGNGRPFFAKIINPKKRNRLLRKSSNLDPVFLSELRKLSVQPKGSIPFKSEVSITVDTKNLVSSSKLKKLSFLKNAEIINYSKDKKNTPKRIYNIHYKKLGKTSFLLDLLVDGGIPIKSFVQNSVLTPNISELLENQCSCKKLDFKNIVV
tara:strand:- start:959 stop:1900 length:942 start_codon:yes stop_codon:yes gene_type:complete